MHRVVSCYLDEDMGAVPSFGSQFAERAKQDLGMVLEGGESAARVNRCQLSKKKLRVLVNGEWITVNIPGLIRPDPTAPINNL